MIVRIKSLLVSLIIVLSIFSLMSGRITPKAHATFVEGPITQDTVWTLIDSPIIITNNVTIYPAATLTIESGVEVRFGGNFSIIVYGKLYANNTIFTTNKVFRTEPTNPDQLKGLWGSIKFNGIEQSKLVECIVTSAEIGVLIENGNVELQGCTIEVCKNAIVVTNGTLTLRESLIQECSTGIAISGNGQVVLQKNNVLACANGIYITGDNTSNVSVNQSIIAGNQNGVRIEAENHANIDVSNNTITSNGKGFYISTLKETRIQNNSIAYNDVGLYYEKGNHTVNYNDIYKNELGASVSSNALVNAEHNYWGGVKGPYHEFLNPYGNGDLVEGDGAHLDFIPFLTKPCGHINLAPAANLLADKIWVLPNQEVMFFATNSYDEDGTIDKYFLDYGDYGTSGWATTSVFIHRYLNAGNYTASLRVMDDYGTISEIVSTTIHVINETIAPLQVTVSLSNTTVYEGEQVTVTVYVTNGTAPIQNVSVTLLAIGRGTFDESEGHTNSEGQFSTTFIAPDIAEPCNVRVVARASTNGTQYADGSSYGYLQVLPYLTVEITVFPYPLSCGRTGEVTVHVKSNEQPIADAIVTLQCDAGTLSSQSGITNLNGQFKSTLTAPMNTITINLTASAIKYVTFDLFGTRILRGSGQTSVPVEPRVAIIEIIAKNHTTASESRMNLTVHVYEVLDYGELNIANASVTVITTGGEVLPSSGVTNNYGNFTFSFTAPPVNEPTNVTILANITKTGYRGIQGEIVIAVSPATFSIQIIATPVKSGEWTNIMVRVTRSEDKLPVKDATITISANGGSFPITTKVTDSSGTCTFSFNAPQTKTQLSLIITVTATKDGYQSSESQATMVVVPVTAEEGGGWPLTTLLLIIIPIVLLIVVVILIKLKIIVISVGEEEK